MSANVNVLNVLNLINPRLGKFYTLTGINPLPKGFVEEEGKIEEFLYLKQMCENIKIPDFVYCEKNIVKNCFKNSIKNIKKIQNKLIFYTNFQPEFLNNLKLYLNLREILTSLFIKEFKNQNFDEVEAYQEIYCLNPIFANLTTSLFDENLDVEALLYDLEDKYKISYNEKLQLLGTKTNNAKKSNK